MDNDQTPPEPSRDAVISEQIIELWQDIDSCEDCFWIFTPCDKCDDRLDQIEQLKRGLSDYHE